MLGRSRASQYPPHLLQHAPQSPLLKERRKKKKNKDKNTQPQPQPRACKPAQASARAAADLTEQLSSLAMLVHPSCNTAYSELISRLWSALVFYDRGDLRDLDGLLHRDVIPVLTSRKTMAIEPLYDAWTELQARRREESDIRERIRHLKAELKKRKHEEHLLRGTVDAMERQTDEMTERLARRNLQYSQAVAERSALRCSAALSSADDYLKDREQCAELYARISDVAFQVHGKQEELDDLNSSYEVVEAETRGLQTHCEIVEQAVCSMSHVVDVHVAAALDGAGDQQAQQAAQHHRRHAFAGKGTSHAVPIFLRTTEARIPQVTLSKQLVELVIKEVWALKAVDDGKRRRLGMRVLTLAEFFHEYALERFGRDKDVHCCKRRCTFTYNFTSSLNAYAYDGDVELFAKILMDEVCEAHYFDQIALVAHLKKLCGELDDLDGVRDGLVPTDVFFAGLSLFFPRKSAAAMQTLVDLVYRDHVVVVGNVKARQVDVSSMLEETEDGDQADFIEAMRSRTTKFTLSFGVALD